MEAYLDLVVDTFLSEDIEKELLQISPEYVGRTDWFEGAGLSVDEVVNEFRTYPELELGGGGFLIPLHEEDSPELTGEYVIYRQQDDEELLKRDDSDPNELHYGIVEEPGDFIEVQEAENTYIAWRMRYWHSGFRPESPPSFLPEESYDNRPPAPPATVDANDQLDADAFQAYVDGVLDWMEAEQRNEREEVWENQRGTDIGRIIRRNSGIRNAQFSYSDGAVVIHAPVDDPTSRNSIQTQLDIYEYNIVAVSVDADGDTPDIAGTVDEISHNTIKIDLDWDTADNPEELRDNLTDRGSVSVGVISKNIAHRREREAFLKLLPDQGAELLAGRRTLEFAPPLAVSLSTSLELNRFQRKAAINARRARDVYCIHGPPGTGKTRTLTAVIEDAVADGERILVCTHSNQAVDNLIEGDSDPGDPDPESLHGIVQREGYKLTRIGSDVQSRVVQRHYCGTDYDYPHIVATTTNSSEKLGDFARFDHVVVDEATQASTPATAVPFSRARSIILAGDHKQLPPYSSTEKDAEEEYHTSFFEKVVERYGDDVMTTLRRQYRMHQAIADFASHAFYDGLLKHGEGNRDATIDRLDAILGIHATGEETRINASPANEHEAELATRRVQKALQADVAPSDIGVITPYNGQKHRIQEKLRSAVSGDTAREVKVATIDSFQGSQKEAIIVSFVRSNRENNAGFLEFPSEGPRRLNVALTRPKKHLVLIGDWSTLTQPASHRGHSDSCCDVYNRLQQYLEERGDFVRER